VKVDRLNLGDLACVLGGIALLRRPELTGPQGTVTTRQKSAEGKVDVSADPLERDTDPKGQKRPGLTRSQRYDEGPNGPPC